MHEPVPLHPIARMLLIEELLRRRRASEVRRQASAQRAATIDPNPHQIDAVMFALARIPEGGCILADEVGLGKTIEAGLIVSQLLAEGMRRILIITPKALLGQWRNELANLFYLAPRELSRSSPASETDGVYLTTRDYAGSARGAAQLCACQPFDLCVIDEAHEVFAGIYKRFQSGGENEAILAARVAEFLHSARTPVLLLTATPIQNSLFELWGLVHYIDPSHTILGDLATFRDLFCDSDGRALAEGMSQELQQRLSPVLKRTLRRQAQEFIQVPFVGRNPRLFDYEMSPEERALYDDVTEYLLQRDSHAFRCKQRALLVISFHRLMASSTAALRSGLENVATRLHKLLHGDVMSARPGEEHQAILHDLGDFEENSTSDGSLFKLDLDDVVEAEATILEPRGDLLGSQAPSSVEAAIQVGPTADASDIPTCSVSSELALVESLLSRARTLPTDGKADALIAALGVVFEQAAMGKGKGKAIIFTESLTTQGYLQSLLVSRGVVTANEITVFRGTNDSPQAKRALARWREEVGDVHGAGERLSDSAAMRPALVHEFRVRSKVLICTEAGAKGLNLQFCDTVINYDLPWNPQRIEQRIGRAHRYGQDRDVTVINFIAKGNEAQRLIYEILSQKLELFGAVLGASDDVLHRADRSAALMSALGPDFALQLHRIYERARSLDEIIRETAQLHERIMASQPVRDEAKRHTALLIQVGLDASVRQVFHNIQKELPRHLSEFDHQLALLVRDYLSCLGARYRTERIGDSTALHIEPHPALPAGWRVGGTAIVGPLPDETAWRSLHLKHPLVLAAIDREAAQRPRGELAATSTVRATDLLHLRGKRGRMRLLRLVHRGVEHVEAVVPVIVLEGEATALPPAQAKQLLAEGLSQCSPLRRSVDEATLSDAVDERVLEEATANNALERADLEQARGRLQRWLEDRIAMLERERRDCDQRIAAAENQRAKAQGAAQRERIEAQRYQATQARDAVLARINKLRSRDDEQYRQRLRQFEERRRTIQHEALLDVELEII